MRDGVLKLVASVMLLVFPLSLAAADLNAAMLQASGLVTLNGLHAPRSSAVFAGDRIATYPGAAVSLTLTGSSVLLLADSAAVYRTQAIELDAGTAVVTTERGLSAHVAQLTVAPAAKGTARFQVTRAQGQVLIAALRGPVAVSDGATTKTVDEGASTTVPDPAPPPPAQANGNNGLAIAVGLAAAAAAAGIAIATTSTPSSSSRP